ncbi:RNA polymerase sigma factor [Shouchella shacheensis]|uniref:RNA polymerase sigma factor n=1 Tax=Shouchella shacheensis TaxID=1649580 RepID=UPI0007401408|nr:sigma-70 family RNA polymerase sigma factor [Shouchella shacheensis]
MPPKDEELYQRILNQNRQALEQLYERYEKILFSFIFRFTKDKGLAEEVMQDVFIKLWKGQTSYDPSRGKFSSWLLTIARNKAIDAIRKAKRTETAPLYEQDTDRVDTETVEGTIEQKEEQDTVRTAVRELPAEQQYVVKLFYFEGQSQTKIAQQSDLPLGTVKGRLRLALKRLRKQLGSLDGRGDVHE